MHAIGTVPRLYNQVLHLMNKMNLPPPFGPVRRDATPAVVSSGRVYSVASFQHTKLHYSLSERQMTLWPAMNQK